MKRSHLVSIGAVAAAICCESAFAQSGAVQRRLEGATRIDCAFSTLVTADWDGTQTQATADASEFTASFFDINTDEGTAEADSRFGASFIVARYANGYLHLMQMFNAGPLYLTTVLAHETADGRLMAIHTRHEYSPIVLPGFTSRPEIYVGDCAVSE